MKTKMPTFTGLTGARDLAARKSGRVFFVFLHEAGTFKVTTDEKEAGTWDKAGWWSDWCAVAAPSERLALLRYERAHDQWYERENELCAKGGR